MAALLYRLGKSSARRPWLVLTTWAVLLVVLAALSLGLRQTSTPEAGLSIPGTEASQGLDVVEAKFTGGDAGAGTATVVLAAPEGQTLTAGDARAALQGVLAELRGIDGVASVTDPLAEGSTTLSADQTIASSTVVFTTASGDVGDETREDFLAVTGQDVSTTSGDLEVAATSDFLPSVGHTAEAVGIGIALVVLVLTYGSLVAAGANLLTAAAGVGVGLLGITTLGKVLPLSSTTPALAAMLGLAVGIDYALFIFARARTEMRRGLPVREAVAKATGTAGTAVVFAGATVVVALTGLVVVDIPFLTEMGVAAAATVAVAVLIALTAVPAALSLMGRRCLPRRERDADLPALAAAAAAADEASSRDDVSDAHLAGPGFLGRWSRAVTRRPAAALVAAVALAAVVAVPLASMRLALPSPENADPTSSSRQAYDLLVEGFGEGSQATLVVVVDGLAGSDADQVTAAASSVTAAVQPLDGVVAVTPAIPSADGSAQLITVVPASGPTDEATTDLVHDIRAAVAGTADAEVLVTGTTALNIDVSEALNDALPVYVVVIVALALLLLLLLFRSVAVPLMATAGFLLSLGASLGAVVAIYQWGWLSDVFGVAQPGPILSFMPVLVVGILFGLAMDYQMFLVSAIHEEHAHGRRTRQAVLAGFRRSAPVVAAAALIMAGVFFGFAFSGDTTIGPIGMALALGVLVDAFLVRMVIMPAALSLLGDKAWWMPRWLQRVVPNVDAEGRGLEALLAAEGAGAGARVAGGREPVAAGGSQRVG